jgi:hypothetical protein
MATIALPRSPAPRQVGPLLDVSSSRSNSHPKQTALDMKKYSIAHPSSPPPQKHLPKSAASIFQNDNNQDYYDQHYPVSAKQDQVLVSIIDKKMASPSSNKQLPYSAPSTPSARATVSSYSSFSILVHITGQQKSTITSSS